MRGVCLISLRGIETRKIRVFVLWDFLASLGKRIVLRILSGGWGKS